ncbi:gliding motility-associated C-terminal domain-containing protein [Fluviicola taffensis]|uniref:PKD domain containing protein n=1 Tax=Fluviicola taffensis (strain DSM 16823 / NCIMB 13979 / RW262) TaxID=755732 RepID=F2IA98_FLUTR|nr:gliding motility-associated C-terminal domain-containing protein [Fluviicola taffensis]AEA42033.1 PKD domain containing protein [Fluviicola taffensis DSM 16823]
MRKLVLFISILVTSSQLFSQNCFITVTPMDTTVCPGSPVSVTAMASLLNSNQSFNFNTSSIPAGWTTSGGLGFAPPCAPASPDGTAFYWASTTSSTPAITTASFDIHCPGGYVTFEMIYANTFTSPCEQLDQWNEGVALQYSTNNGGTWTTIVYYTWNGTVLTSIPTATTPGASGTTSMSSWGSYTVPIPPAANTTNTRFRWFQQNTSGNGYDNWGLDNIVINAMGGSCSDNVDLVWSNGLTGDSNTLISGAPGSDSTFTIAVYDTNGVYQCSSAPITIHVYDDNLSYNLQDYAYSYCPTTNPSVQATNITGAIPPYTVNWTDIPSTNNPQALPTGGAEHDTITYHVTIADGCGFNRQDSVILIVNKLLNIDSLVPYNASSCNNDGAVVAYVSGQTTIPTQPIYHWNGPGATNPSFINSTVWTNRSPGWYYFLVTDNVCTDYDSVQVEPKNPPMAVISANPLAGCDPFDVVFQNNSQNATHYLWTFGDGTSVTTNDLSSQTHTYSSDAQIMLVAYDATNCSDTTYISVSVQICGCTDPLAENYDPTAVANDGSCNYPQPVYNVPNIFTPNGDSNNDYFEIEAINYSNIEFTIVNRWGNLVYQGSGLNPKWDGKINSTLADDGVFFVTFKITNIKADKIYEGQTFVHLVR